MRQRGREAPADFQLIGFDNTPTTAQYSYQLTTLHQDVAAIARQALARLLERAADPSQPSRTTGGGNLNSPAHVALCYLRAGL